MESANVKSRRRVRPLSSFCRHFWENCGRSQINDPEALAMEMRRYYTMRGEIHLADIRELMISEMGIDDIEEYSPAAAGHGFNLTAAGYIVVSIKLTESDEVQAFTLAHELREIIGSLIKQEHPRFVDVSGATLEAHADAFASALLLGEAAFSRDAIETGFDPILLGARYNRSHRQMILRIIKRLADIRGPSVFWGTVYKLRDDLPDGYVLSYGSHRSPAFDRKSRGIMPNGLFAKRGQMIGITGLLKEAVTQGRSVYIERVRGVDHWDKCSLSVIIRPYLVERKLDSVIAIGLPFSERESFRRQVMRVRPIMIEESFQL